MVEPKNRQSRWRVEPIGSGQGEEGNGPAAARAAVSLQDAGTDFQLCLRSPARSAVRFESVDPPVDSQARVRVSRECDP
jgi:hypothetical protein